MDKVPEDVIRERQFLKRKIKALSEEYRAKVTHDFSRYIYVGAKENCKLALEGAVNSITTCAGYEAHRLVLYKNAVATSIYARFVDPSYAMAAAERLLQQEGYCVDMVNAMLLSWYLEEMLKGKFPWTLAIVSIEGRPELPNPLSQDELQGVLVQFGDPKINTYQNGNQIEHVQVLFSSMSEALGASIAHGRWFEGNANPRFYYNIQIMSSKKEAALLRSIQTKKPEADQELEAFEMDYFVQKTGIKTSCREEESFWPNSVTPATSRDLGSSPRVREFRRQFSRGRGNGGRGRSGNPRWLYENRNSRRLPNYASQTLSHQEFQNNFSK
ncbi:hypothetical protein AVEN_55312-1 [Araneus ventricosus]|uniref:Uncharacterized protein n=1 Tax=Araneus ventricosus TaxID=182803 RepID=A0A4Y2D8B6_ARAVE|nr:hypothetical protein AVEN_55312-1 [Araneus ventricosus]